jgi:hypothetical protein
MILENSKLHLEEENGGERGLTRRNILPIREHDCAQQQALYENMNNTGGRKLLEPGIIDQGFTDRDWMQFFLK